MPQLLAFQSSPRERALLPNLPWFVRLAVVAVTCLVVPTVSAAGPSTSTSPDELPSCRFPGTSKSNTCAAPRGQWSIAWREAAGSRRHALLLRSHPNGEASSFFEFDRSVEVRWSSNGSAFAITDYHGSTDAAAWVYWGERFEQRANLEQALKDDLGEMAGFYENGHRLFEAVEWFGVAVLRFRVRAYDRSSTEKYVGAFRYQVGGEVADERPSEMYTGLIGLLALPEVFGSGGGSSDRKPVPLFSDPRDPKPLDEIRGRGLASAGGTNACHGPSAAGRRREHPVEVLPTREYDYEAPAALVIARQGDWFKIRTCGGVAWMQATRTSRYYSIEELVKKNVAYLTTAWDGSFYAAPGGPRLGPSAIRWKAPADVLDVKRVAGGLWLLVEAGRSKCDPDGVQPPATKGWVRADGYDGAPAVWFHSRGC